MDRQVAGLLNHPYPVRIWSDPDDVGPPAALMDDEENEHVHGSAQRPYSGGEEVAGPERLGMALQELVPGPLAPLGAGVQPLFLKDLHHGRARHADDAQLLQLAGDPRVAEATFAANADDQGSDVGGRWTPSRTARHPPRFALGLQPPKEGPGRHDRDQVL